MDSRSDADLSVNRRQDVVGSLPEGHLSSL